MNCGFSLYKNVWFFHSHIPHWHHKVDWILKWIQNRKSENWLIFLIGDISLTIFHIKFSIIFSQINETISIVGMIFFIPKKNVILLQEKLEIIIRYYILFSIRIIGENNILICFIRINCNFLKLNLNLGSSGPK